VFEIGREPTIVWSADAADSRGDEQVLLARARSIELRAFLDWGGAIWSPNGYHYRLPSGRHTSSFVRIADAFQDLRAAAALSTWLYAALSDEAPTTLILDVGTLMPLVVELQAATERHRAALPDSSADAQPVVALDRYPSSTLGLQRNLLRISPDNPLLGLVSVTDSGGFAERLLSACAALGAPNVRIEQVVSRQLPGATCAYVGHDTSSEHQDSEVNPEERHALATSAALNRAIEDPWLSLGDYDESGHNDDDCPLCRDSRTARLVRINPRAMSAMILPEPDLVVPDIFDASRNASVWEAYNESREQDEAVSLLGPTGTRPGSESVHVIQESVFFEPTHLLTEHPDELIGKRLASFESFPKRSGADSVRDQVQQAHSLVARSAGVVIFEQQERDLFSDDEWQRLCDAFVEHGFVAAKATWCGYSIDEGLDLSVHPEGAEASSVLVLALGSRTGLSCQRAFLAGRQQWPNASFCGVVVHAHPEDDRVWAIIRNTFTDPDGGKRLLALWLTYMPDWSPLTTERDTYRAAQQRGLNSGELSRRLEELTAMEEAEQTALPGRTLLGRAGPSLQPHSYLGQELGSRETLCAVGASMQAARLRARADGAPTWTQFDLRRILRSYFDGLIHSCVLRWCEPHETWWGPQSDDCAGFLQELESLDFDFDLLLPELLLACAQDKLPTAAAAHLIQVASRRLNGSGVNLDARTKDHLRLGVDLCELVLVKPLAASPSTV